MHDKPKLLTGLNQNGTWSAAPAFVTAHTDTKTTGVQAGPTPRVVMSAEHGKPDESPATAKSTARKTDGSAGRGMRSKRRPFCNRADTDCNIVRRESELTSARSSMARETDKPRSGGRQMTGSVAQARACVEDAGAPPTYDMNWEQLDWAEITEEALTARSGRRRCRR